MSQHSNYRYVIGSCTSYTFFWGSCILHVSNIIVELRKLIQMIIKLIFFVGEVNSKTRASCFIRFPNAQKQQNHMACSLIVSNVSRVWKPDETLTLIFEIWLEIFQPDRNFQTSSFINYLSISQLILSPSYPTPSPKSPLSVNTN